MNLASSNLPALPAEWDEDDQQLSTGESLPSGWQMKRLKPLHKQIASLLAQGAKHVDIAAVVNVTPQYVSMLTRQPLMKAYIAEMCEVTGVRLEAMFEKVVDTIAETLENGSEAGKLKAARLHLEATKRIGRADLAPRSGEDATDRLERLAERLIFLQSGQRPPGLYDHETGEAITEAEFTESVSRQESQSA